jgi:hypothetical protein
MANLRPGTRRYTIETLAAGQPRPYADTVHHVRVTMEWVPYKKRESDDEYQFEPSTFEEPLARQVLAGLRCGFIDFDYKPAKYLLDYDVGSSTSTAEKTMDNYFRTRLDWLRNPEPGVWEFHTTSPYTD